MSEYGEYSRVPVENLPWAVHQYQDSRRRQNYALYCSYYDGHQPLALATDKFKKEFRDVFKDYAENVCPTVVDSLCDRLEIVGFESSDIETKDEPVPSIIDGVPPRTKVTTQDDEGARAWDLWNENRMDLRSTEVHQEALLMGDSYVIVWPDEDMRPAIWPQLADEVSVQYDPNTPGKILRGCKRWFDEIAKKWYLNIYLEDRIDKYMSRESPQGFPQTKDSFAQIDSVPNPYGRVPIFPFTNRSEGKPGVSELKDIISLQDGLNKSDVDLLIAMEFASYKQRYIIGMEAEVDEETGEVTDQTAKNYGVDRMLAIADPEAKVGQFDATDLGQFLRVQDKFWASVARVSGTPLHYFLISTGDFPSGEAMKSSEARFTKRITDHQTAWGNIWEDVMMFAMNIDKASTAEDLELSALWTDASPRSDAELADTAVKKKAIGVPRSQLLREQGYDEEQIERFLEESDAESLAKAKLMEKPEDEGSPGSQQRSTAQPSGQNTRGVTQ